MGKKITNEEWIRQRTAQYRGYYTYERTVYEGNRKNVIITCPVHGDFTTTGSGHTRSGCLKCYHNRLKKPVDVVIEKFISVHGTRYDYSRVRENYENVNTKVAIICHNHPQQREFFQKPAVHLNGSGCPACACNYNYTTEEFIDKCNKLHRNYYIYDDVIYTYRDTLIKIRCPKHGLFEQSAGNHLRGNGCSHCKHKSEGKVLNWLNEQSSNICGVSVDIDTQITFPDLKSDKDRHYKFDFSVDSLMIELDGDQHFRQVAKWEPPEVFRQRDIEKTKYLIKNNYHLIRIYQPWVYSDTNDWELRLMTAIEELYVCEDTKSQIVYIGPDGMYDNHKEAISQFI